MLALNWVSACSISGHKAPRSPVLETLDTRSTNTSTVRFRRYPQGNGSLLFLDYLVSVFFLLTKPSEG